jgi:hypothetical protein
MDIFLRLKHWQLFLLLFGLPIIFDMVMFDYAIGSSLNGHPEALLNTLRFFPVLMILFTGGLFGWFWAMAIKLQPKVPASIHMKTGRFKILFLTPTIYIGCLLIFLCYVFGAYPRFLTPDNMLAIGGIWAIMIPLHLLSMGCIFYCLYFVAKTLKTVELQREVTFNDFAGEFFLIWFYPIGVWIIQPRVNKLVNANS